MSAGEVLKYFDSTNTGLSTAEAQSRIAVYGANALVEQRRASAARIFCRQFRSFLIWILIAAAVIAALIGDEIDAAAIVMLNAAFGCWQEFMAENSIAGLKKLTAPQAKVWRDGKLGTMSASNLVPDDLIELEAGDLVPADGRLIQAISMSCVESALTGESDRVAKNTETLAFSLFLGETIRREEKASETAEDEHDDSQCLEDLMTLLRGAGPSLSHHEDEPKHHDGENSEEAKPMGRNDMAITGSRSLLRCC